MEKSLCVLIACPNVDGWHPDIILQYLFVQINGKWGCMDNPSFALVHDKARQEELMIVWAACHFCKGRGVTGVTHFDFKQDLPPDSFETWESEPES